jgi:hypothetical protein
MDEQHRALREDAKSGADRDEEQSTRAPTPRIENPDHRHQHTDRQHGIEQEQRAVHQPDERGREHDRSHPRHVSIGPQPLRERGHERQRRYSACGTDQSNPELHGPDHSPAGEDEPEEQRWLVTVRRAVQMGNEVLPTEPHLPRDRSVSCLVDRQERPTRDGDRHRYQPGCGEQWSRTAPPRTAASVSEIPNAYIGPRIRQGASHPGGSRFLSVANRPSAVAHLRHLAGAGVR